MNFRYVVYTFIVIVTLAAAAVVQAQSGGPGTCPSDSKLLNGGPTAVYGEGPGTFWGLVVNGLAAGLTSDQQKIDYLNQQVFGTDFATLDELRDYNLELLSITYDNNQNGYICAYELRGTRAYYGDPLINLTYFGISDDRVRR
jgi:hypothetical protein